MAGADESTQTMEERDVSPPELFLDTSEVLITAHSGTASQHNSTANFSTFSCEKLGADAESASGQAPQDPDAAEFASGEALQDLDAAEFASGQAVQDPDAAEFASGEALQDPDAAEFASGQALQDPDAAEFASRQALQDPGATSSKEESATASPQTVPHYTIDGSSSAFQSSLDKFVVGATESIHTVTQQDPDVAYLDKLFHELAHELLNKSSEELITANPGAVPHNTTSGSLQSASSHGSDILIRHPPGVSFCTFYIRMDRKGSFWTYPHVGGPFHSVDEADDAILHFLDELRHGGRMKQDCAPTNPNLPGNNTTDYQERCLIQALLDQYNEDNNLFMDLAHKLEDLVGKQMIIENFRWFYHFNFTTKQQANDGTSDKLFFAEVSHMQGEKAWEVTCCRMINTENNDGGGRCYGCKNNGSPCMQHPNDTSAYIGGRLDIFSPFGLECDASHYYQNDDDDEGVIVDDDYVYDDDDDDDDDDDFDVAATRGGWPLLGTWLERISAEYSYV